MKELLSKHKHKLRLEALIKSSMYGLGIGSLSGLLISGVFYLNEIDKLGTILTIWIGLAIISGVALYFTLFKVTEKDLAKRLDHELQLDERMITYLEYKEDASLMANKQRENTKQNIKAKQNTSIRFKNIYKPLFIIGLIFVLATVATVLTDIKVTSINIDPPTETEISEEDQIIQDMIDELRNIVEEAPVSDELKTELNELINQLEVEYKELDTTNQKIAMIEDTEREIIERINEALEEETSIIDELQERETTKELGEALETRNQENIQEKIDEMIEEFLQMDTTQMEEYIEELAADIEESITDAEIQDEDLEEELNDLVEQLRMMIPQIDSTDPQDSADELEEKLEELSEALTETSEDQLLEEMEQEISDALEQLGKEQPEEPEEPEETEEPEGHEEDSAAAGGGNELNNPIIIDGETEFNQEVYDQIVQDLTEMIDAGLITEEELIELVNAYINNIELKED